MTRFYSIVLLLSMSLTTIGQSHDFTSNNNELETKLIRVFEWVLEARFSQDDRKELSRLVESSLRSSNPADLKSLQDVVKLNDLIDTIPPGREAEVRAPIQRNILEQLRNQPNDPTAKLLLSVYNNAHSKKSYDLSQVSSNARQQDRPYQSQGSTTVPSELVGEWQARRGSGSSYYNPNSGSYGAPNGTVDSYKFFADGSYEHALLIQNSLYNCTIRLFGRETGKTVVEGNTLTITPGPGTFEYNDTCRSHLNSRKVTHVDGQRWQWQVGRDEYGVKLCVRDQEGASACYYRQ